MSIKLTRKRSNQMSKMSTINEEDHSGSDDVYDDEHS